ncbi:MAG: hypothetical protein IJU52_08505 [Clostridia bacterium]|nr:hypothetical protein [Clostridia bacterium]
MPLNTVKLHLPRATFACVNGSKGFVSYFEELLAPCRFLIVLKGAPGTGKSGLMKKLAERREREGENVRIILCSSDPHSLDGVWFADRNAAVVDGTAPHVFEVSPPGAGGETVDLLNYADRRALRARAEEIGALNKKKKAAYERGYLLLSAAGKVWEARASLMRERLKKEAFDAAVRRTAGKMKSRAGAGVFPKSAFCAEGIIQIDAWEREAQRTYALSPFFGAEYLFTAALGAAGPYACSPDPVSMLPDSLFDRQNGTLVRCGKPNKGEKAIGLRALFEIDDKTRAELRRSLKTEDALKTGAQRALEEAMRAHFALERIYGEAMDFPAFSDLEERLDALIRSL